MRGLVILIALTVIYYALKTIIRSAFKTYQDDGARKQVKGEDMILDPQCRTYVIKERAVIRRIRGSVHSFCSEDCAARYEENHRDR